MYIADLHIHSRYSRATSRDLGPEQLDYWARRKGIRILGTGDFTHPAWREELKEKLRPAEEGFYTLKPGLKIKDATAEAGGNARFVITGEISSIYKKNGKVRKVHSLILLPSLEAAELLSKKLETIGNIHSDGRPILGLDCRDLLEITLEICSSAIYIPAHIWTPHFSLFGAFSGFDTMEECYEDLTPHIHAVETGLSSDPPMNWRLSALDSYQLVSNSDAHSPSKLGREANILNIEMSYQGLYGAIQQGDGLEGTIEFFPEEGKYHFDGHRKCHLCFSPMEAERYDGKCPVCGRKLTIGVSHRVEQLADRKEGFRLEGARPFESLVPLPEVIAASTGRSAAGAKVQIQYEEMLAGLGSEFSILREIPIEDIRANAGYLVSEGIRRLREGNVERLPGFDGEYGKIKLFTPSEIDNLDGQMSLFAGWTADETALAAEPSAASQKTETDQTCASAASFVSCKNVSASGPDCDFEKTASASHLPFELNPEQTLAVRSVSRAAAVIAGPGTGKTRTLVERISYLLEARRIKPSQITAVTFTNKAAEEMRTRLEEKMGGKQAVKKLQIGTFHSICFNLLRKEGLEFLMADESEMLEVAREAIRAEGLSIKPSRLLRYISLKKAGCTTDEVEMTENQTDQDESASANPQNVPASRMTRAQLEAAEKHYQQGLAQMGALDFDDLLLKALELAEQSKVGAGSFSYLLVDEFQDINPVQYRLIRAWNRGGRELFVIGDPDQAIYGFRGTDAKCFERLKEDEIELEVIRLKQNYRSAPQILSAAEAVISVNSGPRRCQEANREAGYPVRVVTATGEMAEAIFVAKEINRLIGGIDMLDAQEGFSCPDDRRPRSFADIAVLYRTHRQADLLEKCLRREGIPYIVAGRDDFLEADSVRGTICFFRCLADSGDRLSRRLCLKLLWGLSEDCISECVFQAMADKYRKQIKKGRPRKLLDSWVEDMGLAADAAMQKFVSMSVFYKNMQEFLDSLSFGRESDLKRCGKKSYTADAVTLMTLHGAKGLEFSAVLLYGARKGLIPLENGRGPTDVEEERRLFFVGMTRAKEELILTTSQEPSPFFDDMPKETFIPQRANPPREPETVRQLSLFDFI